MGFQPPRLSTWVAIDGWWLQLLWWTHIYFFPTELGDGTSVSFANKNGRQWTVVDGFVAKPAGFATKKVAQHPPRPRVGSPSLCRPSPRPQPSRVQRRCLAPDREVWPGRGSVMVVAISNPPKRCKKANCVTILIVFASLFFFSGVLWVDIDRFCFLAVEEYSSMHQPIFAGYLSLTMTRSY